MGTVLAHDVSEVAAGVVQPVPLEVHLIGKQLAVQRAEGAESVGGKEDAVGNVEGHHGLRPVDHRRTHKGDGVLTEGEGIALLHLDALMPVHMEAELTHEHEGLLVGDQLHLGMAQQDLLDAGGVIRLQMVDQPGNGKAVFKQGQAMVVGAYPIEIICYFTHAIHLILPPSRLKPL